MDNKHKQSNRSLLGVATCLGTVLAQFHRPHGRTTNGVVIPGETPRRNPTDITTLAATQIAVEVGVVSRIGLLIENGTRAIAWTMIGKRRGAVSASQYDETVLTEIVDERETNQRNERLERQSGGGSNKRKRPGRLRNYPFTAQPTIHSTT